MVVQAAKAIIRAFKTAYFMAAFNFLKETIAIDLSIIEAFFAAS